MFTTDPISLFRSQKLAAEKPPASRTKEKLDPGEQATLGFTMMATGVARVLPLVATVPLTMAGTANAPQWASLPLRNVKRLGDVKPAIDAMLGGTPAPAGSHGFTHPDTSKFLNIFDLHLKPLMGEHGPMMSKADLNRLSEMRPVVDAFIDKYDLAKRGVTMDFRRGPLTALLRGAYYDPSSKKAVFPRVSKEIVLHELGHAADFSGRFGLVKKVTQHTLPSVLLNGLIPAAYIAGDEIKKVIPGTVDDKVIEFTQRHGPAIAMAALTAQSLYPEAKASYLAIKHIKEFEGAASAVAAAKRLGPLFGTYVLASLPAMLGFSFAKKYYREAHEKLAGVGEMASGFSKSIGEASDATFDAVGQLLHGFSGVITKPGTVSKLLEGMKTIAVSPEFRTGALISGVPALVSTYAMYSHPGGKELREKYLRRSERRVRSGELPKDELAKIVAERGFDEWREQNPKLYAGLVGMGSAIAGGVLNKVMSDVMDIL